MKPNAINSALGALKLVPMLLNHPTVISRAIQIAPQPLRLHCWKPCPVYRSNWPKCSVALTQ